MNILVISDTHGNVYRAYAAHTRAEPVDAVIHLGDGIADADMLREVLDIPVVTVAGNCDPGSDTPRERLWECEGKRILLTHGDAYRVKSGLDQLLYRALETGCDAALFGHTHHGITEWHGGVLLLNPGALANHTPHRSYAILTITPERITSKHYPID